MALMLKAVGIILLGACGMGLWQVAVHVWADHRNLHTLVTLVQQTQPEKR